MAAEGRFERLGRNERAVMRLVRDAGPCSRTALAAQLGLSATTITKTAAPLLARGYLTEHDTGGGAGIGRPAIPLAAVPEAVTVCGVQLGVGAAAIGLADGRARVRLERSMAIDPGLGAPAVLDLVAAAVAGILARDGGAPCIAVGVAAPGPVDPGRRINLMSVNLGWRDVPVAERLEAKLGIPVHVDHNVRTMALAETLYGGTDVRDLAYVYVRTGVGLGLVLDRRPFYPGLHGLSELGHLRAVEDGAACACGARGCLETVLSEPHLLGRARDAGLLGDGPAHARGVLTVVESAAGSGSRAAVAIRADVVHHLSNALAGVVNLFNPRRIVLGGIFEAAPEPLLADIRAATKRVVFPFLREEFRIERPALPSPGVAGGAALALEAVLYGPS
ncbi:ROK family transcriptional regulator [Dactylosporangium sp. CA-139066]|uniref:ROK family transcriptional regulator n=1 Tax=Dactylosporangium sp. CA-139066 TaxID=3239930 RepID=UPI003D8CE2E0